MDPVRVKDWPEGDLNSVKLGLGNKRSHLSRALKPRQASTEPFSGTQNNGLFGVVPVLT